MKYASKEEIEEFIHRRFPEDCNWTTGNCYYFARILKMRFGGKIGYDPINGHFSVKIGNDYYDHTGQTQPLEWVSWTRFYDEEQKSRIKDCCIK